MRECTVTVRIANRADGTGSGGKEHTSSGADMCGRETGRNGGISEGKRITVKGY